MQNIEHVYSQYQSRLLGFIRQRVGDPDLSQDILHDVFVKIVGRQDSLREPARITAWLYQVTRNAIIDRLRSSRPYEQLPQEIADAGEVPTAESKLAGFLANDRYFATNLSRCCHPVRSRGRAAKANCGTRRSNHLRC